MTGEAFEPARDDERPAADCDDDAAVDVEDDGEHLEDVPDGSGCTEIWEHLSDRRESDE